MGTYGVVLVTILMQSMMGHTLRQRVQPVQLSMITGRWVSGSNLIACKRRERGGEKAITLEQLSTLHRRISPLQGELFRAAKKSNDNDSGQHNSVVLKVNSWPPSLLTEPD